MSTSGDLSGSLETTLPAVTTESDTLALHEESINASYLLLVACLVFIMQIGFMALETGSVGRVFKKEIIFKNFEDIFIGILSFSILGYSFAFDNEGSSFIGGFKYFALMNVPAADWLFVLFQMCFVGTAATIVSGCVVERMTSESYALFSFFLTLIVYPPIVHWCWSSEGWLLDMGFVDFAGSGVVHLTGGLAGLVLIQFLRERTGRGCGIKELDHQDTDLFTVGVGVFLLWVGWFGFNCGSVILMVGDGTPELVGLIAVNVIVSAAVAAFTSNVYLRGVYHADNFDFTQSLNCLLTGLVAITAGCHQMQPWAAAVCGVEATICYFLWEKLMKKLNVDDPLSVVTVHGMGGVLGVINVGLFSDTGDAETAGIFHGGGKQLGIQLLGLITIIAWVTVWIIVISKGLSLSMGINASWFRPDQGVKLWVESPTLAFKALFVANHKKDPAARVWLWCFKDFVRNVYPDDAELVDRIVVIDEFIGKCHETMAQTTIRNENGIYDFTEVRDKVNPWIEQINATYIGLNSKEQENEQKGGDEVVEENDDPKMDQLAVSAASSTMGSRTPRTPSVGNGEEMDLQIKISGIKKAGTDLTTHFGDKEYVEDLLEMRYAHLFDAVREKAFKKLLKPWLVFTQRPPAKALYTLTPDKIYDLDVNDWSLKWIDELKA